MSNSGEKLVSGKDQGLELIEGETKPVHPDEVTLREAIERQLDLLTDDPNTPKAIVFEFINKHRGQRRYPPHTISTVTERYEEGDYIGALAVLETEIRHGPVSRNPGAARRQLSRDLKVVLSPEGAVITKGQQSRALAWGHAFHSADQDAEIALTYQQSLAGLCPKPIDLVLDSESEVVTGIIIGEPQSSFGIIIPEADEATESGPETIFQPQGSLFVQFETPLPTPEAGIKLEEWAMAGIRRSIDELISNQWLPTKPYDVAKALENEKPRQLLTAALEYGHVIFGDRNGISLITKNDAEDKGSIGINSLPELAVLNWLSLLDTLTNFQPNPESGLMKELQVGDIDLFYFDEEGKRQNIAVKGGVLDLTNFHFFQPGTLPWEKAEAVPDSKATAAEFTRFFEKESQSQAKRHWHRKTVETDIGDDKIEISEKVTRTKMGRTLFSYFRTLFQEYGEDWVLNRFGILIDDLKFPAGDGDWSRVFIRDNLPVKKHTEKMEEYVFLTVAQLYRAWLWHKRDTSESDNTALDQARGRSGVPPIHVREIADFAKTNGLLDKVNGRRKIRGRNRYQLPDGEAIYGVSFQLGYKDLEHAGERVLGERISAQSQTHDLHALRIINLATEHRLENIEVVRRVPEVRKLPEAFEPFCFEYDDRHHLGIEEFASALYDYGSLKEGVSIRKGVNFGDDEAYIVWLSGLDGVSGELRVAFNLNANEFSIIGINEGLVRGRLISREDMRRVVEDQKHLSDTFDRRIARPLWLNEMLDYAPTWAGEDYEYDRRGEKHDVVKGKPLIYKLDLMTNRYYIDRDEVEKVASAQGDVFDMARIVECINDNPEGPINVFCPIRWHMNYRHEAAAYYGGETPSFTCFAGDCKERIESPTGEAIEAIPTAKGDQVEHYITGPPIRRKVIATCLEAGSILLNHDQVAQDYLHRRGLSPEDFGLCAAYRSNLVRAIYDLMMDDTPEPPKWPEKRDAFWKVSSLVGQRLTIKSFIERENQFVLGADKNGELVKDAEEVMRILDSLPLSKHERGKLERIFNLADLKNMQIWDLINLSRARELRLGGRFVVPAYWPIQDQLEIIGINARGIKLLDGTEIFEGNPHNKARVPKLSREKRKAIAEKEGFAPRSAPPGFWFKDPEAFLLGAGTQKAVVVTEGPITTASLDLIMGKDNPEFNHLYLTNLGLGHRQTIAFLRWLGIDGDDCPGRKMGIKRVFLAFDCDKDAVVTFWRMKQRLEALFPNLEVLPIQPYLPDDVRQLLPDFYRDGMPAATEEELAKHFIKRKEEGDKKDRWYWRGNDGQWHHSWDANDLLRMPGIREKYARQR